VVEDGCIGDKFVFVLGVILCNADLAQVNL